MVLRTGDERFSIVVARPRNDRLQRPEKIPHRRAAHTLDRSTFQRGKNLIQDRHRRLASFPFSGGAKQIFLGHHFQNRPDILGHPAVDEHQTVLQLFARLIACIAIIQDAVIRQQPSTADPKLRIIFLCGRPFDQLHPRPYTA